MRIAGWATSGFALHLVYIIVCSLYEPPSENGPARSRQDANAEGTARSRPDTDADAPGTQADAAATHADADVTLADANSTHADTAATHDDDGSGYGGDASSPCKVRCYSICLAFFWNQLLVSVRQLFVCLFQF